MCVWPEPLTLTIQSKLRWCVVHIQKRHKSDREINNRPVQVLTNGKYDTVLVFGVEFVAFSLSFRIVQFFNLIAFDTPITGSSSSDMSCGLRFNTVEWCDLKIGEIVKITSDAPIPVRAHRAHA